MGNKSTREIREKIEQFKEDSEKKEIDWIIHNQNEVYEQMLLLSRYFSIQKLQLSFIDPNIGDITPLRDAIQGSEIFEVLKIQAQNTKINDSNIIPSHITTLSRFHLDLSNTQITDVSNVIQVLNQNIQLESIYLNFNKTHITSIKLFDVHLFTQLKSLTLFAGHTQLNNIEQFALNISKLQHLEELHLDFGATQITDLAPLGSGIRKLNKLLQLTIKLDNLQMENLFELMQGISFCINLCHLTLTFNNTNLNNIDQLGDLLKQLQNLEYLNIQFSNTKVTQADNLFQKIGYLTALKSLSLNFKDTAISSLTLHRILNSIQKIEHLRISANKNFDQSVLDAIPQQSQMKSLILDLNDTNLNSINKLMDQIGDLKLMRFLQILISNTQVEELNCSNLSKLQNLRTLQIDISQTPMQKIIGLEQELGQIKFLNQFIFDTVDTKFHNNEYKERIKQELKKLEYLKEFHL
ncbi:unnamed protein product (macronuclear) [Paramecium tetraurelia]|uniref:Kinase domain protein n=1 Tax=Paramecium tetraurelia TaxID=5888 RepID=A0C2A4_PARTE|nr:uncharacterized protein GSPATT00034398001 [Paramecium tetraurelia]CAK64921.1 unnamed protein product [Paramecium tetraurelia]|eukprot:XP_001432318.1 hypothetical protein (macronuclear) [Paramecium tetraurelia strain d4-2]